MPTVTLKNLKDRCYSKLDGNRLFYDEISELPDAINECVRVVNLYVGFIQTTVPVESGITTANRVFYDVPDSILIPIRLQFEDTYLQKTFPNNIGKSNATWVRDTTDNTAIPVSFWIPMGFRKFAIHPADSLGGASLLMTGVAEPALLVNDTDTIVIPNEYSDCIVSLAAQILTLKETGALFKQSSLYYQEFTRLMKKCTAWRSMVQPRYYLPETAQKQ